jgi:hypothetical protein
MTLIKYIGYETRDKSDTGLYKVFCFYPDGVWDEYKRTYSEAVEAYPFDEYAWVEIEEGD